MDWFIEAFRKYAVLRGRASRSEFWCFVLISVVVSAVLTVIDLVIGRLDEATGRGLLSGLFGLLTLVPLVAVGVRRLHDTGRSGWWLLIGLVPLVGSLVLLVFTLRRGDPAPNPYGPVPTLPA